MPIYDIDGIAVGVADANDVPASLTHEIVDPVSGIATAQATQQILFLVSGQVVGSGDLLDETIGLSGATTGSGSVTGNLRRILMVSGYTQGTSQVTVSLPEPIFGVAVVTAHMEVIHVPPPVCQTSQTATSFRWGHVFTTGDLALCVADGSGNSIGPLYVGYTLYQIRRGCVPIQVGPSDRKPAFSSPGCYYVTGTAGECGQPGQWLIRWAYQLTFNAPMIEKDCYFTVLDHVLGPEFGDTFQRNCKYGWD